MTEVVEEIIPYWLAKCPTCDWIGKSIECIGSGEMDEKGEYSILVCPECHKQHKWNTVIQSNER